jgi:hypothetical protein|nr:MAG TPA: BppU domain protein [Caudoviricetes sp.]
MATIDDFRGIELDLDAVNTWVPDVRLNAGDVNGRLIRIALSDHGAPVAADGLTARLLYNTDGRLGDRIDMTPVSDAATATFQAPVPRAALKSSHVTLGVEIDKGTTRVCSRNFTGVVEPAVFASDAGSGDALGQIEQLIADSRKATTAANDAANAATQAANDARDAANAIRTSKVEYDQLSDDAKTKIAASAGAGVVFATQEEIDEQYDDVIAPVLTGASIPPLTQDDIDWALGLINR